MLVTTLPWSSPMTQNERVGQETLSRNVMSGLSVDHAAAPAAGSSDCARPSLPPSSTATHSDSATHEILWPMSALPASSGAGDVADHAPAAPAGLVEVSTVSATSLAGVVPPA